MYGNDEAICLEQLSKLYQRKDSLALLSTIKLKYILLVLDRTQILQTSNSFEFDRSNFEFTQTQVRLLKPNFKPTQTPSKKNEIRSCLARNGPNTKPKFGKTEFQTLPNPGSSTKTKLRTHPNPTQISRTRNPQTGIDPTTRNITN